MRFAVHWPGTPVASPRFHDVPRRDVACRVYVSVAGVSAGNAGETRLALARPRVHVPARRASLARVRGWYLLDPARCLFVHAAHEQAPTGGEDAPVQASLRGDVPAWSSNCSLGRAGHASDVKVLDADHVEVAGQSGGQLFAPVLAPVGFTRLEPRDRGLHSRAPVRAVLRPSKLAFQAAQSLLLCGGQAGNMQRFTRGQSGGNSHTSVNSDDHSGARAFDRVRGARERDMPAARSIAGNPKRLHAVRYLPGPAEPHPAHLRDAHLAPVLVESADVPLWAPSAHDAEPFVPACLPPRGFPVRAFEEVVHGMREVPKSLLLHDVASFMKPRVLCAGGGELTALLHESRRGTPPRTPPRLLLDRQVPHEPGVRAMSQQCGLLFDRRPKAIPGHVNIIANTLGLFRSNGWAVHSAFR